jgi:hypothetical protein
MIRGWNLSNAENSMINLRQIPLPLRCLFAVLLLGTTTGANCMRRGPTGVAPQMILPQAAPLDHLLSAINANTAKVRTVFSTNASLRADGAPIDLSANLAIERPGNFRLRGQTTITGPELDVGSNPTEYWLWVKRNQPPALYYGRHDQFAQSQAGQIFPIEPAWLIEAFGLVSFDPQQQIQGPIPRGNDQVEVRTTRMANGKQVQQVTVIDARRALVLEQHLYTPQGQRIASALTSEHRMDVLSGAALPRKVVLEWPASKMKITIDITDLQVNTLGPEQANLFLKPEYQGFPNVDLGAAGVQFAPTASGANALQNVPANAIPPSANAVNPNPATAPQQFGNPAALQPNITPATIPANPWNNPAGNPNVYPAVQPPPRTSSAAPQYPVQPASFQTPVADPQPPNAVHATGFNQHLNAAAPAYVPNATMNISPSGQ